VPKLSRKMILGIALPAAGLLGLAILMIVPQEKKTDPSTSENAQTVEDHEDHYDFSMVVEGRGPAISDTSLPDGAGGPAAVQAPASSSTPSGSPPTVIPAGKSPDFAAILAHLKKWDFQTAGNQVKQWKAVSLSDADQKRLVRVSLAVQYAGNYYRGVQSALKRYSPPKELCDGECILVENGEKPVIRIAGENLRFSFQQPNQKGHDLFDILFRHRYAKVLEKGKMAPALEYAAFLLTAPSGDRARAAELLKQVQEKGDETEREHAAFLKLEFGI